MVKRSATREAFDKPISKLDKNLKVISRCGIDIDSMRLMVLQADCFVTNTNSLLDE